MSEETFKTSLYEERKIVECDAPSIPELPFVSLELNLRTLQDFLTQLLAAVNKNTQQIKSLKEELNKKVSFQELASLVDGVSSAFPVDLLVNKTEPKGINDLVAILTAGTQKMCEKVSALERFQEISETDLKEIWERLKEKLDFHLFESEKKNLVESLEGKVQNSSFKKHLKKIKEKLKNEEEKSSLKTVDFLKKISELKTEFLWKLNDCERLLQTRVNEQFVWEALEVLEKKLTKQRDTQTSLKLSSQQALFEKFQSSLKALDSKLESAVTYSNSSILLLEKELKANAESEKNRIGEEIKSLELKLAPQDRKIKNLEENQVNFESVFNSRPLVPQSLTQDIFSINEKLKNLESEYQKKIDKNFVVELMSSVKPKQQNPSPDLDDLWKFQSQNLASFSKLEKKIEGIVSALDLPNLKAFPLNLTKSQRTIKTVEGPTKEDFLTLSQRLSILDQNQSELFKELDRLDSLLKKLVLSLEESNVSPFALLSKKSLTSNCLSCGRGETSSVVPTAPHVKGVDGRFYRVDLSSLRPDSKLENESISKSPLSRLPRAGLNSIISRDLTPIGSQSNRPASAKKII